MSAFREPRLTATCVFFGSKGPLNDDHVPPKTLFPKPRPSNLIKVPSCITSNWGASKDDEYFRLVISMRHDTGDHPAVKAILPSVYRSLEKTKKRGFREALFNSMKDIDIVTADGIYLGTATGYNVDLRRLDSVAARITAGLYFHEFGTPVSENVRIKVYALDGVDANSSAKLQLTEISKKVIKSSQPRIFGDNVFVYWYQAAQNNTAMTVWGLAFYERFLFLALTMPKNAA
jgi:hypothetical protein